MRAPFGRWTRHGRLAHLRGARLRFISQNSDIAHLFPSPGTDLAEHRYYLSQHILARDGRCWVESCQGGEMWWLHEGVYRRSRVQGWQPRKDRILIHTPYNCIGLCEQHHETTLEPSSAEIVEWMLLTYGEDFICWCRWLRFKRNPLEAWLSGH